MNNITISGFIGNDIEKRVFLSGSSVYIFNVAVKRLYSNKNGEYDTQWIECRIYGNESNFTRYAERVCKKGSYVIVSGELNINRYKGKNNNWQCSPYIAVNRLEHINVEKKRENNLDGFSTEQSIDDDVLF